MAKSRYLEPCPECGQYKYEDDNCTKCEVRQEIAFRERLAKSKPTQLPWRVQHNEVNSDIFDADGRHIATVFPHCNAKHIVDCVNARAGNGEVVGYLNIPGPYNNEPYFNPSKYLSLPDGKYALYRHPSPAPDMAEVERLVDNVAMKARAHTPWDDDTMREYHEARAALLRAVRKGEGE